MDPVNKWLTVIILFMSAVLILAWNVGSVGRYELSVEESTLFKNHAVVYVIDTKDGSVQAKLVDENDLHYDNKVKRSPQKIFSQPSNSYGRKY